MSTTGQSPEDALPEDLRAWIGEVTGGRLVSARRMPGGGRKQAWFVDVEHGATIDPLFLRWDPSDPEQTGDPWTVRREAEVYRGLRDTPVPVARFLASHPVHQAMLATRVRGNNWFSAIRDPDEALATAKDFIRHLAAVHRLDPRELDVPHLDATLPVPDLVRLQLAEIDDLVAFRGGDPEPVLFLALEWLRANVPSFPGPAVLVQGDTGPGNFMYEGGAVTAIVDWELAHLGDPMDDVAWLSLRSVQEPFTDLAARLDEYVALTGNTIDAPRVKYYRVLAEAKIMAMNHGVSLRTRADAPGGGGDVGARLVFGQLHRRLLVECLADVLGIALQAAEPPPEPPTSDLDDLFGIVLDQLRSVIVPRIADPFAVQRTKGMARVLKYLANATRRRASFEQEERRELAAVLARPVDDLDTGRALFAGAVRAGSIGVTDALAVIHRRVERENELLRDASGALADRRYAPLE